MFPNRSGGQVAYLEQAYPKPTFFFPVTYAFFTVVFSFASSNAVVLARYIFRAAGHTATEWENKGLAMASYTVISFLCLISTRWSIRLMNLISVVKLIILLFIVITGFVVLAGGTQVENPKANFQNSFDGITNNGNDIVNALVSINFAYAGYANAFNVVAEIKVSFLNTGLISLTTDRTRRTLSILSSSLRQFPSQLFLSSTFSPTLPISPPFPLLRFASLANSLLLCSSKPSLEPSMPAVFPLSSPSARQETSWLLLSALPDRSANVRVRVCFHGRISGPPHGHSEHHLHPPCSNGRQR